MSKKCFVISPIGAESSEVRKHSDKVFKFIISRAAVKCGYEPIRADHISKPGIITSDIIQHLIEDEIVIADLTGHNPNVFYELAVRHVLRKPVVQIIQVGEKIPFDVGQIRTIEYELELEGVEKCEKSLVEYIKAIEKNPNEVINPVTVSVDFSELRASNNPTEKFNAQIIEMLNRLYSEMNSLQGLVMSTPSFEDILSLRSDLRSKDTLINDQQNTIDYLQHQLRDLQHQKEKEIDDDDANDYIEFIDEVDDIPF